MDRQDIDALLIGALYGELTPADEARLAAHLDSHPADRGALDDFKNVRLAVRESRIFELQLDPPQAVSALLLQEAHRRAPKRVVRQDEKEGWFARFTRAFIAHPAMAAAAMLVLVVGVAGTVYMKRGDHFAGQQASAPQVEVSSTAEPAPEPAVGAAAGSSYPVGLAEANELKPEDNNVARDDDAKQQIAAAEPQKAPAERERKQSKKGIAVATKSAMPKELEKSDSFGYTEGRAATSGAAAAPQPSAPGAQPAPAQVATTPSKKSEAQAQTVDSTTSMDPKLLAWAKQQHQAAVKASQAGNCGRAATIAIEIGNRAPDYYSQKMATDRELKYCQQQIADKRNEEAEQKQKSRASKRVNADEAYEAPAPSK